MQKQVQQQPPEPDLVLAHDPFATTEYTKSTEASAQSQCHEASGKEDQRALHRSQQLQQNWSHQLLIVESPVQLL